MWSRYNKPVAIMQPYVVENGYYYDAKTYKVHGVLRNNTKNSYEMVNVDAEFWHGRDLYGYRMLHFDHLKPLERRPFSKDGLDGPYSHPDKIVLKYEPPMGPGQG